MAIAIPDRLLAAYRNTAYHVYTAAGELVLRVDASSVALDELLQVHDCEIWAYLSAHNPGLLLPPEINVNRDRALAARLAVSGFPCYSGESHADRGDWPPEASWLILGIPLYSAIDLAREFDQVAILAGRRGEPAKLVACADRQAVPKS